MATSFRGNRRLQVCADDITKVLSRLGALRVLLRRKPKPRVESNAGEVKRNIIQEDQFSDAERYKVKIVTEGVLEQDDIIVVLMGPTGSGKSTFIETASGIEGWVGHGLQSHTNAIQAVRITFRDSIQVVLVDTPGFDDTYRSDLDILKLISGWLQSSYENGLFLSGILYFHRISDNRMPGTPLKNLEMFKKLCGEDAYDKVILTTTMWQEVDQEEGISRENQLANLFWRELVERGSKLQRLEENTRKSTWDILNQIISWEFDRRVVQIQAELVDHRKILPHTQAGRQLHGIIEQLVVQQEEVLKRMREEMLKTSDPVVMRELTNELVMLRRKRETALGDMRKLDSLTSRIRRMSYRKGSVSR